MNHRPPRTRPTRPMHRAFTLVEMLVVLAIILLVVGLIFPFISKMQSQSRVSAGVNTVGLAAETARRFALRQVPTPEFPLEAKYSGVAAIVCPSGEIRFAANDMTALRAAGNYTEDETTTISGVVQATPWNAFADIPGIEFAQIPKRVRILGITRTSNGVRYIDPPFAIRFDERGRLVVGTSLSQSTPNTIDRLVFYDHDHDGLYQNVPRPASGGDPATSANPTDPYHKWTYEYQANDEPGSVPGLGSTYGAQTAYGDPAPWWDPDAQKHRLPFGRLISVVGVRVVNDLDPDDYRDVYFSRYTGAPIREEFLP